MHLPTWQASTLLLRCGMMWCWVALPPAISVLSFLEFFLDTFPKWLSISNMDGDAEPQETKITLTMLHSHTTWSWEPHIKTQLCAASLPSSLVHAETHTGGNYMVDTTAVALYLVSPQPFFMNNTNHSKTLKYMCFFVCVVSHQIFRS